MKNNHLTRLLSFVLALAMVMSIGVVPVAAEEDTTNACAHTSCTDVSVTKAATCTEDGAKIVQCEQCTLQLTRVIPAGHSFADGTCTVCGEADPNYVAPCTHIWNEGVVTTEPTCTALGVKTFTCTVDGCGYTYTEDVAMVSHSYGEDNKCACGAEKPADQTPPPADNSLPEVVECDRSETCPATENHAEDCKKAIADAEAAAKAAEEAAAADQAKIDEVNALINALPETVTAENYESVMTQLGAIMAKQAEMGDLWAQINQTKLQAVIAMTQIPAPPIDTTIDTIPELQSAVAAQVGATISVETVLTVVSGETVNLDLNGCTVNLLSIVNNGGTLSISNGTLNGIATSNSTIQHNSGKLTLSNVTVTGKRHAVRIEAGEVIISSGNYTAIYDANITNYAVNTSGGTLTISGGTFTGPGGKDSGGAAFIAQAGSTATIKGGKFVDSSIKTYTSGALTVKGGTFDEDLTNSQYVAAGYEVKAVDGGFWSVSEKVFAVTVTSADGTTSTGFDTLADAVNASTTTTGSIILINEAGTYDLPGFHNKDLTFVGFDKEKVIIIDAANENNQAWNGSSIHFENLTAQGTSTDNFGLANTVDVSYKNCILNDQRYLYAQTVSFENCIFNQTNADKYHLWTYGAGSVTFSGCTLNSAGKALLVYNHGGNATNVTISGCTFNASAPVSGKAAVEIDTSYLTGTSNIVIDAATKANGFDKGSKSGDTLWNVKNHKDYNATVTVAGEKVFPIYPFVVIDSDNRENGYASLATAVAECEGGETILINEAGTYDLPIFANKELTFVGFDKDKVIINDAPTATTQGWNGSTFHFKNLTAAGATENYHGLANGVAEVTYQECVVKNLRHLYATNVSFDGCNFDSGAQEHSFYTYGASNVTVNNCEFNYADRAVNCYSESVATHKTTITFTDCKFINTDGSSDGAVEINSSSIAGITVTMNGCTAPSVGKMWYISSYDQEKGEKTIVDVNGVRVWPVSPFFVDTNNDGKQNSSEPGCNTMEEAVTAANRYTSNVTVVCKAAPAAGTYAPNGLVTLSYNGNSINLPMGGTVSYDANGTATIQSNFSEEFGYGIAIMTYKENGMTAGNIPYILSENAKLTLDANGKLTEVPGTDGEITTLPYHLIPKENKNTFVQTSTSTLTFTSNMFFETFSGVAKLDGVELKAGDF
ncbi:MAG: hypothetical protein J6J12_05840, partial [Oscillospiraceae bacterium]|nr:hypothetical protein [Oscillospiraceae bacterium]